MGWRSGVLGAWPQLQTDPGNRSTKDLGHRKYFVCLESCYKRCNGSHSGPGNEAAVLGVTGHGYRGDSHPQHAGLLWKPICLLEAVLSRLEASGWREFANWKSSSGCTAVKSQTFHFLKKAWRVRSLRLKVSINFWWWSMESEWGSHLM